MEGLKVASDHIIATVFKRAEENDGYILRCYETAGKGKNTTISVPMINRSWSARFQKCEIKTFWIPDDVNAEIAEVNLLESVDR